MKSVQTKLSELRSIMGQLEINAYIIPSSDYHQSEYIGDYFKCREYMSGFTGSAGTLIVTPDEAVLYTDGRYFIQAERELSDTGIKLMKMGEPGVISQREYVMNVCKTDGNVALDGKVVSADYVDKFQNIKVLSDRDLVGEIWKNRPELKGNSIFILEEKYAGESVESKLKGVRKVMEEAGADYHILTSLDDIAWLFNIRGNDIMYNPVALAYVIIDKKSGIIYLKKEAVTQNICEYFDSLNIEIKDYDVFYNDLDILNGTVLLDKTRVNYTAWTKLKGNRIINKENPTTIMKAIKNDTEIDNLRKAHIMDGVAVTRFMYWLKKAVAEGEYITEISAEEKLEQFRSEYESYISPSFHTISAYGANAAMMHYEADDRNNAVLQPKGFLLVDSGGQYFEGTTDVTRTFALGELSGEEKKHFTLVTASMLRLADAKFLYGCKGINLDILAREPLWKEGIDYKCGTGHGVGYLLNVHEGPNAFRWRSHGGSDSCVLEAGMVTTDEPGVYLEGKYGIRIENELLCCELNTNEHGKFMGFDVFTMVPIDLDAIDVEYLDKSDIQNLNNYHQMVYNTIATFLNEDEKNWLKEYTRPL